MSNTNTIGFQNNISKFREVKFYDSEGNELFWRNSFKNNTVNENVLLIPNEPIVNFSSKVELADFEVGSAPSQVPGVGTLLGMADALNNFANNETVYPEYTGIVFNKLNNLELKNEISFTFRYGQAGLYNAWEEVIKPINSLCNTFGFKEKTTENSKILSVDLPFPSNESLQWDQVKMLAKLFTKNSEYKKKKEAAESNAKLIEGKTLDGKTLIDKASSWATELNYIFQLELSKTLQENLKKSSGVISVSFGNLKFDYVTYTGISYDLDYKNLDEYGYPITGTFTLSGLSCARKGSKEFLLDPLYKSIYETPTKSGANVKTGINYNVEDLDIDSFIKNKK